MKKNIHFFNTFELVVPLWQGVAPLLAGKGITVKFVICKGKYRDQKRSMKEELYDFVWSPTFLKQKMISHISYFFLTPLKILFRKSALNIFFTQPPFFFIYGAFWSRLKGVPYIVHIMDYEPDMLVAMGLLKKESFLFKQLEKLATRTLEKAEKVVVIGRCMKQFVLSKGIEKHKVELVENVTSVSLVNVNEEEGENFRNKYGLTEQLIVLYSGNMGRPHEFHTILKVADQLSDHSEVKFVFAGYGARKIEIEQFVKAHPNAKIKVMEFLPDDAFARLLSVANLHFISLRPAFTGLVVPSKFYSSIAAAKPVVFEGSPESELALEIQEQDIGTFVGYEDTASLRTTILSYLDSSLEDRQHYNAIQLHQTKYSYTELVKKYSNLLTETLD